MSKGVIGWLRRWSRIETWCGLSFDSWRFMSYSRFIATARSSIYLSEQYRIELDGVRICLSQYVLYLS